MATEPHFAPPEFLGRGFFALKVRSRQSQTLMWTPWLGRAHRARQASTCLFPNDVLGEDYTKEFTPVIDTQLSLAGIRLAQILNDAFT
jgi:hypothetical protein